jgi:hypothetical protein
MAVDVFAGTPVGDYERAREWYERLLGAEPDRHETYESGVPKVTFRDPDGNQIGLGGSATEGRHRAAR